MAFHTWSTDTRFKKTEIESFPGDGVSKNFDVQYWKHLQFPVTVQEFGPISCIDVSLQRPHFIAVTGSTRVQIFNPLTNEVHKTLAKFRGGAYGGRFRRDGNLLCVGGDDGAVKVFDVTSKTLLRLLKSDVTPSVGGNGPLLQNSSNHVATKCCHFTVDLCHVAGFSDDKSVRLWDLATEEIVASWTDKHKDYVRAGCVSETSADILVSGSYDHTIRMWDRRKANDSTCAFDHGCPVEAVLFLPNGSLLVSSGGHEIRIWDLLAGRLLKKMSPHNKTVTSLGLATDGTRLVSSSLDRQVKLHDMSTFQTVHSISFPSPVLTAAISADDSVVCAGMSNGLVQFLHRKVPPSLAEKEALIHHKKKASLQYRYLQFTDFMPQTGDVVVKQEVGMKQSRHDFFLRKFEYSKALDQVLKPYVQRKFPEYTYSVLKELRRRNGINRALGGRDEKSLTLILQYLSKYINDPRFSHLLIEVMDQVLDIYGPTLGNCPSTDKLFVGIRKRVERETRNLKELMTLQGTLDLILAASRTTDKAQLRAEEWALKKEAEEKANKNISNPSSNAMLSWEKTLLHSIF